MTESAIPIEPAATIILLRDSAEGPQVLMQQRSPEAVFVGGAWVFPGGKLDSHDQDTRWLAHCPLDSAAADQTLGLQHTDAPAAVAGFSYWIAAIRELVEEAGILLCQGADSQLAHQLQGHLRLYPSGFLGYCQHHQLQLCTEQLYYLSRWITPPGSPRRYDTRFFLGLWPQDQDPLQDDHEAINTLWVTPEQALARQQTAGWLLVLPTLMTLRQLSGYPDVATMLQELGQTAEPKNR